jgi:hypothetical protein
MANALQDVAIYIRVVRFSVVLPEQKKKLMENSSTHDFPSPASLRH